MMTSDLQCPLTDKTFSCPAIPLLNAVLDKMETIDQKISDAKVKSKKLPKIASISVNALIVAVQIEYPEKTWTSDSFAEAIGCTGAAVRKTEQWRLYQQRLKNERSRHPKPNGTKDKQGNIEAVDRHTNDN